MHRPIAVLALLGAALPSPLLAQGMLPLQNQWDQMRTYQMRRDLERQTGQSASPGSGGQSCRQACGSDNLRCLTSNTPQRVCNQRAAACRSAC